jgi:hypothetical protein
MAVKEMIIIDKKQHRHANTQKLIRSIGALKNQTGKGIAVDEIGHNFIDNAFKQ